MVLIGMEHGSNGEEEHALVAPEVADDGVEAGFVRTQGPQDAEIEDLEIDEGFAARTRFDGGIGLCENALDITGDVTGEAKDKLKGFLGNPRVVIFQPLLNPFSKNVAIYWLQDDAAQLFVEGSLGAGGEFLQETRI